MIFNNKNLTIHIWSFGYSMYCYLYYRTKCVYPTAKQFMEHIVHFLHKMLHEILETILCDNFVKQNPTNMHFSNYIYIYQILSTWLSSCTAFSFHCINLKSLVVWFKISFQNFNWYISSTLIRLTITEYYIMSYFYSL